MNVAIVGATGAVGTELLKVLAGRKFPLNTLGLFASKRSTNKQVDFCNKTYPIRELNEASFKQEKYDLAFFSAGGSLSRTYAPLAAKTGCVVIDNSSAFRMDPQVPLVVPEVNPEDTAKHQGIIANPNCSTIIMLMAISPIHRISPIRKIVISTYQAASGAGTLAMQELRTQADDYLHNRPLKKEIFPYPIAFNAFSHNSEVNPDSGYNQEEIKIINETHKILKDKTITIDPTCIRIATFRAHGESIHLELKEKISLEGVRKALLAFEGVELIDERSKNYFPTPIEASNQDNVLVGRLRQTPNTDKAASTDGKDSKNGKTNQISLWCCGDQIRKGAALNAVQIAEQLNI